MNKKIINENQKYCEICGKERKLVDKGMCYVYLDDCNCAENRDIQLKNAYPFKKYGRKLKNANFGYIYRNTRLKKLNCEYIKECKNYVEDFTPRTQKGLFLVGNTGTGKTSLAVGIAKELLFKGYSVNFMVFSQVIRLLQSTYGQKNKLEFMEQVEILSKYDLLIFDDFGRNSLTDRTLVDVFDFIDYIYKNCNNVIITANLEQIAKFKQIPDLTAILDRIKQMTTSYILKGKSLRS